MNERIKQLAVEAGIYQPERFNGIDGTNQLEKFAHLIAQVCIAEAVKTIKEHYGVKE